MDNIVIDPTLLWNLILSLIIVPVGVLVRTILAEQKRMDILINKTREEIAKDYVTRDQLEKDLEKLISTVERMDEKLDRIQTKTYFQD
tara:strand:+ start:2069 stop:2332 length:264 start_codon:yes stop_codon:yes gene_type:complete